MKNVLLLATGGTIASQPTLRGGLAPAVTATDLLRFVPELRGLCAVDAIQLYHLDSTNMGPAQWLGLARALRDNYDRYDGFVITHGTDTMAYTAAALCYLVQGGSKPIVLTGSQKSDDSYVAAALEALISQADVVDDRRVTSWPSVRTDLTNAGADVVDEEVVVDGKLITSRKPDDIPAFNDAVMKQLLVLQQAGSDPGPTS